MKKSLVKQQDENDCGAACHLSIIKYYRGYVPLEQIKIDTLTNSEGTNFYYLKTAAEKYGFEVIGKKDLSFNEIKLPSICQMNLNGYNHFVVLFKINKQLTIMDPAKGFLKLSKKEFNKDFTGKILEFHPKGNIVKYNKDNKFLIILKNIYRKNIKKIFKTLLLVILLIILSLISNFNLLLIQKNKYIIIVFIIVALKIIINYIKSIAIYNLNKEINFDLIKTYTSTIINLPLKYLQLKKPGDFINRINDLHTIKDFFTKTIIEIIINVIFFIATLIILLILNKKVTIYLLLLSIFYIITVTLLNNNLYKKIALLLDAENVFLDRVVEYLNKIKTIKTLNISYFLNNIKKDLIKSLELKKRFDYKISKIEIIKNFFEESMLLFILILHFKVNQDVTLAIIFLSVYGYFLESIKYAADAIPSFIYLKEIYYRISSIYDLDIKMKKRIKSDSIEMRNLSFSYNKISNVLNKYNLKITEKDKVFLQGDNGSGKSTLLNIISGLYDCDSGLIKVPEKICYLDQESKLFKDTILNNIILNKNFEKEKFSQIEKLLYLPDVIKDKTLGYNTNIESISNISGGEMQKIILARSIYQDFNVLLMDESLSLIAQKTRIKILENINKHFEDKTIIYVSHFENEYKYNKKINLTATKEL